MKQKIIDWLKNIDGLIWMKLWAAIILGVCSYWIFSDREVTFNTVLYLPWIYFYITDLYITKKIVVLLVPLLMNIALWVPCYVSYIFIRVVLYAERIIAIAWAVYTFGLLLLGRLFGAYGSVTDLLIISGICILFNELILYKFQTEAYKEKFSAKLKTEQAITPLLRKLAPIFYLAVYLLLSGENLQQDSFPEIYAPIETRNVIKIVGMNTIEKEMNYKISFQPRLSENEKMLLLKDEKTLFVVDINNMQTINTLQSKNNPKQNFYNNDYVFTPDGKYIADSNIETKIKFSVINIATGETDTRFSDPQELLKKVSQSVEEVPFIRFDPSGDYFAVVSRVNHNNHRLEFWDYNRGTLIYVEEIKGKVEDITWITDRKCIILYQRYEEEIEQLYNEKTQSFYDKTIKKKIAFVEQREISNDGSILATSKEKITADIKGEEWSYLHERGNFIESDYTGKYLSIFLNQENVDIWEIETEKKIFSLNSDNTILDIIFHPDGQRLIVFERLKGGKNRITFWDIVKRKKERILLIQEPIRLRGNITLFDKGNKILLNTNELIIVSLEGVAKEAP